MTNLEYFASLPPQEAEEIMATKCPFQTQSGVCSSKDCPHLYDGFCSDLDVGFRKYVKWLMSESEEETK